MYDNILNSKHMIKYVDVCKYIIPQISKSGDSNQNWSSKDDYTANKYIWKISRLIVERWLYSNHAKLDDDLIMPWLSKDNYTAIYEDDAMIVER